MSIGGDFFVAAVMSALVSCAVSNLRVAGVETFGRTQDVTVADIEAAIAAYKTSESEKVGPAEVISHDEIRIYQDRECRNYTAMVRVKREWEVGRVVLVHPRY